MTGASLFEQINRLSRRHWTSIDEFAQEFMSIFKQTMPITTEAPFTINNANPSVPALTIKQSLDPTNPKNGGKGTLQFSNNDGSGGSLQVDKSKGLTFTPNGGTKNALSPAAKSSGSAGGGGIPGQVLSGTGDTYTVGLYEKGKAAGQTKSVTVTQLQIATGETIPVGTWTIVTKTGTVYSMQVPVWVGDIT